MELYDVGDKARLSVAFADTAGTLTDPDAVTLLIRDGQGTETSHVYGVDPGVVRASVGQYYYDQIFTCDGLWAQRWIGVGTLDTAVETEIVVNLTDFSAPLPGGGGVPLAP